MKPVFAAVGLFVCSLLHAEDGFVPMFNGRDLSGWVNASCAPETWGVKDGVITCTGIPTGALRTNKQYENFIMEVEWRHLTSGGNSGVFIWGTAISAPGVPFLRGIEVQVLDHGYLAKADPKKPRWFTVHGDVFPIHGATMTPHGEFNGSRSFPSEERSKPSPEWNHYRIEGRDGRLTLAVNGKVVSGGDNCNYRKGYLALESEGAPVEFRNARIKELPSTNTPPELTAPLDEGWRPLYTGVDLRGWKLPFQGSDRWQPSNWQIKLQPGVGSAPLWAAVEVADCQVICDIQLPKGADLSKPCAGLYVRNNSRPLVLFGAGDSTIAIGSDKVKPNQWYRIKAIIKGNSVAVRLTESQEANPQTFEATVEMPAKGPIGLADFGTAVTYGNIYLAE